MSRWTHIITDNAGTKHRIEENGWDNGTVFLTLDGYKELSLKMYYRPERTWDDHMGNTPCGYYAIVPIKCFYNGAYHIEKRRVYLTLAG